MGGFWAANALSASRLRCNGLYSYLSIVSEKKVRRHHLNTAAEIEESMKILQLCLGVFVLEKEHE